MRTSSPSRKTIARKPSHLGSYSQPSPSGRPSEALASIGSSGGSNGRCIEPIVAVRPSKPATEVDRASATLISIVQGVVSFLIVLAIVWLPVLLGAAVVVVIALAIARRLGWRRPELRSYQPPPSPPAPAAEA